MTLPAPEKLQIVDNAVPIPSPETSLSTDAEAMRTMGKLQQLSRTMNRLTSIAFTTVLMANWEYILIINYQGLVDGGLAGLVWSYVWTVPAYLSIVLSLAEMSSM